MTRYLPTLMNNGLLDMMCDPFDTFFGTTTNRQSNLMNTDIRETDKDYQLEIDLPGFKKEDVNASLKDGYLTITAKTANETDDKAKDGTFLRKERFVGSCNRSFYVGDDVKQEDITAKFDNGVLTITVPKKEPEPAPETPYAISID